MSGVDLALIGPLAADLVEDSSGDLRAVAGVANVVQALGMRLRVRLGELASLGHPGYGSRLHELIGEPNVQRTRILLLAHARTAIEQDPRVERVRAATATVLPGERDTVRLSLEVALVASPDLVTVAYDVRLGGVNP